MRFIVAFLARFSTRNAEAFRLDLQPAAGRARRSGSPMFPALQHHGMPRERFILLVCYWAGGAFGRSLGGLGARQDQAAASRGTCSCAGVLHSIRKQSLAMAGFADQPLTCPPLGRWPRTASEFAGAGFSAHAGGQQRCRTATTP
jgi:hypothetical protein